MATPKYVYYHFPIHVALTAPAVRIVILAVSARPDLSREGWDTFLRTYQVLAIRSQIRQVFCAPNTGDLPPTRATPEDLVRVGWSYKEIESVSEMLIIAEDYGLVDAEFGLDCGNVVWRAVACPWESGEDAEQFASHIEDLKAEAIQKAKRRRD